ncbi:MULTISPECIES: D-cysteine desulfhydrase family protein [unclassified Caballeronia]|uniref:D-cysteine desulfhydrase family protein n=1 Tax=unclassified Caballeronia TaxID=2646786 RepID=UPI002865DEFC|nr:MULTISPECIES: D-cysteine desulfhydrase family protein [unclassified Caballeronia]MDR5776491.1 D-cysteine desulfhydrase family protein [Caballeronia sp. LZ002]MDR5806581.1 D-cysteine desulfhydrase family protein [Caballeronia sp. LZ001]MDR5851727.1 D-cysteine desulfhydrase family protein [Caballeronia sp. LZ003]
MQLVNTGLTAYPRFDLLDGVTPIQRLTRLEREVGDVGIFVKRDDLMGLGGGGNKLRKLEFLIGEALAQRADTVITVGARQSNHARLTAAAASRAGMHCELVLTRSVPRTDAAYTENGNVLLDELLGATIHDLSSSEDPMTLATRRAAELSKNGRRVYVAPLGGSSPVGCLGYAACALEIETQAAGMNLQFDEVVVPHGSGGTHAGLVAGFIASGKDPGYVRTHAVLANEGKARAVSFEKTTATLRLLGREPVHVADDLNVDDSHLGDGYGMPTDSMRDALRTLARAEGLLLDPVYSGKAFAGMLHDIQNGRYRAGQNVLFVMTGGLPGLFAYRSAF